MVDVSATRRIPSPLAQILICMSVFAASLTWFKISSATSPSSVFALWAIAVSCCALAGALFGRARAGMVFGMAMPFIVSLFLCAEMLLLCLVGLGILCVTTKVGGFVLLGGLAFFILFIVPVLLPRVRP